MMKLSLTAFVKLPNLKILTVKEDISKVMEIFVLSKEAFKIVIT